jgi:mono/diheme cytochrome c family protein
MPTPLAEIDMRWMKVSFVVVALIAAMQLPSIAQPLNGDPASGRQIATTQCSSCHRVQPMLFTDKGDPSLSDKDGPPSFQSIADLPSTTGLLLNVFLHSNHKNMPNLVLSHADSDDVIAFILSLKKQ